MLNVHTEQPQSLEAFDKGFIDIMLQSDKG